MPLSTTHTLDGVEVKPGIHVWDYDLRPRIVVEVAYVDHGTGQPTPWWRMQDPVTGRPGTDMDASRMWALHPATGEPALA